MTNGLSSHKREGNSLFYSGHAFSQKALSGDFNFQRAYVAERHTLLVIKIRHTTYSVNKIG